MIPLLLAAALGAAAPSAAPLIGAPLPIPAVEQPRLANAAAIGKLIYDYDQAAWITTDAMVAAIPRDRFPPAGGWVVEPRGDGAMVVTYYGIRDGRTFVHFVAAAKDGKVVGQRVVAEAEGVALTPVQSRMAAARNVTSQKLGRGKHRPCARAAFNSVTLAPATPDSPVSVYYLTPQTVRDSYPFGGHYRFDVDKAGKIVADRAFTRSCIDMSTGENIAGVFITHLLDPTPTEIHVFLSLWMKVPVGVGTADGRMWVVNGANIMLVSKTSKDSPKT